VFFTVILTKIQHKLWQKIFKGGRCRWLQSHNGHLLPATRAIFTQRTRGSCQKALGVASGFQIRISVQLGFTFPVTTVRHLVLNPLGKIYRQNCVLEISQNKGETRSPSCNRRFVAIRIRCNRFGCGWWGSSGTGWRRPTIGGGFRCRRQEALAPKNLLDCAGGVGEWLVGAYHRLEVGIAHPRRGAFAENRFWGTVVRFFWTTRFAGFRREFYKFFGNFL